VIFEYILLFMQDTEPWQNKPYWTFSFVIYWRTDFL
jgi:hypothetical protein